MCALADGLARPSAGSPLRTAAIASAMAANAGAAVAAVLDHVLPPALGVGLAGRRGEGTDRVEDGAGRRRHGVVGREHPGHRHVDRGDGDARGDGPARACHSGLKSANGQKAAARTSSGGSRAGPPAEPAGRRPTHGSTAAQSAGSSTSTMSGRARRGRAAPSGRPRSVVADPEEVQPRSSAELAAGVVEVAPAVPIAHHPLEVLAPGDLVVHRIAHDGADDAGGHVVGPSSPSPKWAARASPLVITEIASAVDSVPLGTLRLVRPSAVRPRAAHGRS